MENKEELKRIKELLEFLVKREISKEISNLSTDEHKVYNLTGNKGQVEMARSTGFSAGKVSKIWVKLEFLGLITKEGKSYRKVI